MTLLWADNFNVYGTDEALLLNGIYAQADSGVTLVVDPDPTSTANVVAIAEAADSTIPYYGNVLRKVFPSGGEDTVGVAFRIWMNALPPTSTNFVYFAFTDSSNTAQVTLKVLTTGDIAAYRGNPENGTLLGTTTVPAIVANSYSHIEAKVTVSDTVGVVEVRVNGVVVLDLENQDTKNTAETTSNQILFTHARNGAGLPLQIYHVKDLVIWNDAGSVNNDFMGTVSVVTLVPDADTSLGGWSPSTGSTGFNILDNAPPLDDAAYVAADVPETAVFTLSNLPDDVTSVRGLVTMFRGRKVDGGDGNIQISMVSAAAEDAGTDHAITTAYTYWPDVNELDPNTAAPWTPVSLNAASIKMVRTV